MTQRTSSTAHIETEQSDSQGFTINRVPNVLCIFFSSQSHHIDMYRH